MKGKNTSKSANETFSKDESRLLSKIGRKVHKDLHDLNKPVEWLAWESEVSRATVRRVLDANRNVGIITLDKISKGLGYKGIQEFLASL